MAPVDEPKSDLSDSRRPSLDGSPKPKDLENLGNYAHQTVESDSEASVGRQIELEAGNSIRYRTCSWQKTSALLFSEYISLSILSFPWAFSVLGVVPGVICTVFVAATVLYTSLIMWKFCLRHPQMRDVCDIGQYLFWNSKWAWYFTAAMFLLNNTFIQGLHCVVGAEYLNTMSGHSRCTVVFSLIWGIICFLFSIPRTFSALSRVGAFSAFFTFVSILLAIIFSAVEDHPAGYNTQKGDPIVTAIPIKGTGFVAAFTAFLNISYTFIGQITLPSFIAEMREPKDFGKAITVVTVAELIFFSIVGGIGYGYTGDQYIESPEFGSISNVIYKKVSFSFMIPTLIFLGVLYASVSARFIFFRLFEGTPHKGNHTLIGWSSWIGVLFLLWAIAFVIAEVIPFFTDLISVLSALFDSFFGFIFWAVAYMRMRRSDYGPHFYKNRGIRGWIGLLVNLFLFGIGVLFLSAGTWVSVESIILSYKEGTVTSPFSCSNDAL